MDDSSIQRESDTDAVLELLGERDFREITTLELAAHHVLFEPDEVAERVYFLLSGEVRVLQSLDGAAERLVSIQGRGSWVGLAPLTGHQSYGFRAIVHRPSTMLTLPTASFFRLVDSSPQLAAGIVRQLASRLIKSCTVATRMSSQDSDTRIIQTLLDLVDSAAAEPIDDGVRIQMTHQDLAKAVGAARETISVALMSLRDQKLIRTRRNQLSFNPSVLRQFAESRREAKKDVEQP